MKTKAAGFAGDVEVYSTAFLPNMLHPRFREKGGKQEPVIHRSTDTAQPPTTYVAYSEYLALHRACDERDALLTLTIETVRRAQTLVYTNNLGHQTPAQAALQNTLQCAVSAYEKLFPSPATVTEQH